MKLAAECNLSCDVDYGQRCLHCSKPYSFCRTHKRATEHNRCECIKWMWRVPAPAAAKETK